MTRNWQWVWWGWDDWKLWIVTVPSSKYGRIYSAYLRIGPLEVRRWSPETRKLWAKQP